MLSATFYVTAIQRSTKNIYRVAVDMDIHGYIRGYIHGYIHVWISDIGCPMDISMDIFTYLNLNCHITSSE